MQQRGFRGPVALVLALLPGLLAGCGPSAVDDVNAPALREDGRALSTGEPYLVRDINPLGQGSRPEAVVVVNGTLFFIRESGPSAGLWKSDGTETGTVLVRSANDFGSARFLTDVGGTLFFYDGLNHALWKSDGTQAGTISIRDDMPQVVATAVVNGRLFLLTNTSLWVSDGTAAGTVPLQSDAFTSARGLVAMNGTLFFSATTSAGVHLWKSDGTASGTAPLKHVSASELTTLQLVPVNGTLFFLVNEFNAIDDSLWRSDGTGEGTFPLKEDVDSFASLVASNGRLFFSSEEELWASDGTKDGTVHVASLDYPLSSLMATPGGVVFSTWRSDQGSELWKSDGTEGGTGLVMDPCPETSFGTPYELASTRNAAFFLISCNPGSTDYALWKSDGTESGTGLVKDGPLRISDGNSSIQETLAVDVNGTLFFWADDGVHGLEPWKSDGTTAGTVLIRDTVPARAGSDPEHLVAVGNTVFFSANDGSNSRRLWKSDGSAAGTTRLNAYSTDDLTAVNGKLFFTQGQTLVTSDGTNAGTVQLRTFSSPTGAPSILSALVDFGGTLFFTVWDNTHAELWKSDGSAAGTVRVKELFTGFSGKINHPVVMNGTLFFIVGDFSERLELWKSDGTAAGTARVKLLLQKDASINAAGVRSMAAVSGKLFLLLQPLSSKNLPLQLWRSDGTEAGTQPFPELFSKTKSPEALVGVDGTLFLVSGRGFELWKSDGTVEGTSLVRQLLPVSGNDYPTLGSMGNVRGRLYLTLYAPARARWELWRSDGTVEGTGLVQPLELGEMNHPNAYSLATFVEAGKRLFFVNDGGEGREPWALPLAPVECPIGLPAVEATSPEGARVDFPAFQRAGDVSASLPVSTSIASGSLFPMGTTQVTLTASDPAYPASTCTFSITVQDTTAPDLRCPETVRVEAPGEAKVDYPPATATDAVSSPVLEYSIASGSTFPNGSTSVEVKATDAAGNKRSCSFNVVVQPEPQGCGCGATSPSAALGWLLALIPLVARRRLLASR
ncbi:ELWxxDGT repeat protein [Archangium lipolyticum]|uniref:ELWxxDGT repeat protein n=1 Tax=Archangium lipolyticum TaxID=2970465 RepID=UPI00214A349B|nr:ELWxxDGT repeat protein [Archangium lipolyticum]